MPFPRRTPGKPAASTNDGFTREVAEPVSAILSPLTTLPVPRPAAPAARGMGHSEPEAHDTADRARRGDLPALCANMNLVSRGRDGPSGAVVGKAVEPAARLVLLGEDADRSTALRLAGKKHGFARQTRILGDERERAGGISQLALTDDL